MRNLAKEDPKFFWLTIFWPFVAAVALDAANEVAISTSGSSECQVLPGLFFRPYLLLTLIFFLGVFAFNSVDINYLVKPRTGFQFFKPWAKFYMLLAMLNQTVMPVSFLVTILLMRQRCDHISMFSQIFYWSCLGLMTILAVLITMLLWAAGGSLVSIMQQHNVSLLQRWKNSKRMNQLRMHLAKYPLPIKGTSEPVVAICEELSNILGINRWYGQWACDFAMYYHFFSFELDRADSELLKEFVDPKCLFCDELFLVGDRLSFNPLCGHLLHYRCSISDLCTYSCPCPLNNCMRYGSKALELIVEGKFIRGVADIKDEITGFGRTRKY